MDLASIQNREKGGIGNQFCFIKGKKKLEHVIMQKALSRITWKCVLIGFQMVHSKETRMSKGNNRQLIERIKTPEQPLGDLFVG